MMNRMLIDPPRNFSSSHSNDSAFVAGYRTTANVLICPQKDGKFHLASSLPWGWKCQQHSGNPPQLLRPAAVEWALCCTKQAKPIRPAEMHTYKPTRRRPNTSHPFGRLSRSSVPILSLLHTLTRPSPYTISLLRVRVRALSLVSLISPE